MRESRVHRIARDVAERVEIVHEGVFRIDGREVRLPDMRAADADALRAVLAQELYARAYTNPVRVNRAMAPTDDRTMVLRFVTELIGANHARVSWTPNCKLVQVEGDYAEVSRADGGTMRVRLDEIDGPDHAGECRVKGAAGSHKYQPSWYWAYGEDNYNVRAADTLRCYWAVTAEGALPLLSTLTRRLNEARVPYRFKTLQDPQEYSRADAAVLYLPRHAWRRAAPHVRAVHAEVKDLLNPVTPLFSLELARGLGAADDPGVANTSFGTHRCRLLADGLVDAWDAGEAGPEAAAERVAARFVAAGLSLDAPHANPGNAGDYAAGFGAPEVAIRVRA